MEEHLTGTPHEHPTGEFHAHSVAARRGPPTVAIIGDGSILPTDPRYALAEALGARVIELGNVLVTGGLGGVMEAAAKGARGSHAYRPGAIVGLLPGLEPSAANAYIDRPIPTGLGHARNFLVAQSDAVIAVGGGAGTLSELAFAWILDRLIIGMRLEGWSGRLAGTRIDARVRFPDIPEDQVFGADSVEEAGRLLEAWLPRYRAAREGKG